MQKQQNKESILTGNILKMMLQIGMPMVLYDLCDFFYDIFDMLVVSTSGVGEVSAIVVLAQIKEMLATLGISVALGGSILVANKLGASREEEAKKSANMLFLIALCIAAGTIFILIPFAIPFLSLFTLKSIVVNSVGYFDIQMITLALFVMNNVFLGLERAKGNSSRLMKLNLGVIAIKISLTSFFIYGPIKNVTVTWIAMATLLAQFFMFINGLKVLFASDNNIAIHLSYLKPDKKCLSELIRISLPLFGGKFLFTYGKVSINQLSAIAYSKTVVGCLGLSNSICGFATTIFRSFQDTSSAVISQNYGNQNKERVLKIRKDTFLLITMSGVICMLLLLLLNHPIVSFLTQTKEAEKILSKLVFFEEISLFFVIIESTYMGYLYGIGKTKLTMTVSTLKIFLFRLLVLYCMIHAGMGYISSGYIKIISAASAAGMAFVFAKWEDRKLCALDNTNRTNTETYVEKVS